jgi:Leucine-rich repeat (LRR) protein
VDTDGSGKISYQEAEAITRLAINNKSIRNLDGIEAFINLELLDCTNDFLKSIDVSNNYALTDLYLGGNLLTSLDVSNNPALKIFGMWRK